MRELIDLEEQGWRALSTTGDTARNFYGRVLREDAVMLFPGNLRIVGRAAILDSLAAQPWESFHLGNVASVPLSADAATVFYEVTARREAGAPYSALVSSTYARSARGWQLVVHQQTPV